MNIINYPSSNLPPVPSDHFLLIDQSGSMYGYGSQVRKQLERYIKKSSGLDTFNLIFFSDSRRVNVFKNLNQSSALQAAMSYTPSGMTSFYKPFSEIANNNNTNKKLVVLFTDGCPTEISAEKEVEKIKAMVEAIGVIHRFNIVGFGQYYDEDFLKGIKEIFPQATFEHQSKTIDVQKFAVEMYPTFATSIDDNAIAAVVSPIGARMTTSKVVLTNPQEYAIVLSHIDEALATEHQYAISEALYRSGRYAEAMLAIDDLALLETMASAFSKDEKALVLDSLMSARLDVTKRHFKGVADPKQFVPDDEAPCTFELLTKLSVSDAIYYPLSDKASAYSAIGAAKDSSGELFVSTGVMQSNFDLVFTEGRFNIGVRARQDGKVVIPPVIAQCVGLDSIHKVYKARTYNLVNDGQLNVETIQVQMSEELANELTRSGYVVNALGETDQYVITLPKTIFNGKYLKMKGDTQAFASLVKEELDLSSIQKVTNYFIDTKGIGKGQYASLTKDQIDVLKSFGISSSGAYAAISDAKPNYTDVQVIKTVKISVSKFSSLPSVDAMLKKVHGNGKLTASESLIFESYQSVSKVSDDQLEKLLKNTKAELNRIRANLWAATVVMFLGGSTVDSSIDYNGLTISIKPDYQQIKV